MKKYESIMRRVRFIEDKYGIKYTKTTDGKFLALQILYTVILGYTHLFIIMFYLSVWLNTSSGSISQENYIQSWRADVINIAVYSVVLILGMILLWTRLKVVGALMSILPHLMLCMIFAPRMAEMNQAGNIYNTKEPTYILGYNLNFYIRHLIPAVLMLCFLVAMIYIAVKAWYKTNKQYKKIIDNLYKTYSTSINTDGENAGITDDQWEEFLKNYDPRDQKKIPAKITADEDDKEAIED